MTSIQAFAAIIISLCAGAAAAGVIVHMRLRGRYGALEGDLKAARASVESLELLNGRREAEISTLRADLGKAREERSSFEGELKVREENLARQIRLAQDAEKEKTLLRGELLRAREERSTLTAELAAGEKNISQQRRLLDDARKELSDVFGALSAGALKNSTEEFLKLAKESLGGMLSETRGKMGEHQEKVGALVKPLQESLKRYDEHVARIEAERQKDQGGLTEQLRQLMTSNSDLRRETLKLSTALRSPQVRGRWGELALRRTVELAGMVEHCDFSEQVSVDADEGPLRPDMIIHLPNGRDVVVDAKVSLSAFLEALSADTEEKRALLMKKHAQQVRDHLNRLSQKAYWGQFKNSPEFVVLFLSNESFFSAALMEDATLIEDGIAKKVVLATPTTLIALLRAIAFGWRQERLAENAERISRLARDLYDRVNTFTVHMGKLGGAINNTVGHFNKAVGSLEARVMPSLRQFKELGVSTDAAIKDIEQISQITREPISELEGGGAELDGGGEPGARADAS
jgi:DNA recombination protein RmuC